MTTIIVEDPYLPPVAEITDLDLLRMLAHPDDTVDGKVIRSLVLEVQAARDAAVEGTPPDLQEWFTFYAGAEADWANNALISNTCHDLQALGASWFRVTKDDDRVYVDGWRTRPVKMAAFVVLDDTADRCCLYELDGRWYLIPVSMRREMEALDIADEIAPGFNPIPEWATPIRDPHGIIFTDPQEF